MIVPPAERVNPPLPLTVAFEDNSIVPPLLIDNDFVASTETEPLTVSFLAEGIARLLFSVKVEPEFTMKLINEFVNVPEFCVKSGLVPVKVKSVIPEVASKVPVLIERLPPKFTVKVPLPDLKFNDPPETVRSPSIECAVVSLFTNVKRWVPCCCIVKLPSTLAKAPPCETSEEVLEQFMITFPHVIPVGKVVAP